MRTIPADVQALMDKDWAEIAPLYDDLLGRTLDAQSINQWLQDWTNLNDQLSEAYSRVYVAHTVDTTDEAAKQRYYRFIEDIVPNWRRADFQAKRALAESGLEPEGFAVPLRNVRGALEIFREENLPLFVEESKLGSRYNEIVGTQTVEWEGEEKTVVQMDPVLKDPERATREKAWRLIAERQLADRQAINDNWVALLELRRQIAANAGFDNYRDFVWKDRGRWDYTPEDCFRFHAAIEKVVVPALGTLYERRRQRLGVDNLRPWDTDVDPYGLPALKPFQNIDNFVEAAQAIFSQVHPDFGGYFQTMRDEALLDLENRKGKAPGGYCTSFEVVKRPFIFMNAVGVHRNVDTLLHEGGHAFHVFETNHLKYHPLGWVPMEFAEVASMAMELLAAPYLEQSQGGYYATADAARARLEHLEKIIWFWPYMAVVDAFQHWVYNNPVDASDPDQCDAQWSALWERFLPFEDWSGLEDVKATGWHRKQHIHRAPFYYIEYGVAQLGAVQVWRNALADKDTALEAYRAGLRLGGTATLPQLYEAAGAKLAFDADTLAQAVDLVMTTINRLEGELEH